MAGTEPCSPIQHPVVDTPQMYTPGREGCWRCLWRPPGSWGWGMRLGLLSLRHPLGGHGPLLAFPNGQIPSSASANSPTNSPANFGRYSVPGNWPRPGAATNYHVSLQQGNLWCPLQRISAER